MQDLLTELLWNNDEVHHAAYELCKTFPGYLDAQQSFDKTAEMVQAILGYELYDKFYTQLSQCTSYEVRAYYSFGLSLREELIRALNM